MYSLSSLNGLYPLPGKGNGSGSMMAENAVKCEDLQTTPFSVGNDFMPTEDQVFPAIKTHRQNTQQ